jgi:hypothetical protein
VRKTKFRNGHRTFGIETWPHGDSTVVPRMFRVSGVRKWAPRLTAVLKQEAIVCSGRAAVQ